MPISRTLVLAVDGLDDSDVKALTGGYLASAFPAPAALLASATALRILPGGPSEPAPALASLITGASVAHTGVPTEAPFRPDQPTTTSTWYSRSLLTATVLQEAAGHGLVTAALQWPATAGAEIDLCLPLVEDLRHYPTRWEMALRTSSPRMVEEHLRPRRDAGVQLSQVPADALVAEIAAEALDRGRIDLMAVRLTGLGAARRAEGLGSARSRRALVDIAEALQQIVTAFAPTAADSLLLVPGRPLVPAALLVHPNTALAARDLVRTDGTRLESFRALVWPDGPRGVLHVRQEEGAAVRESALEALEALIAPTGPSADPTLTLRRVDDGVGATSETDVIAVLEGCPGTVFGLSATHRPLVSGDDPYYAGPRAVTDPSAPTTVLATGPALEGDGREGSWADLGMTLARSLDLRLPGATAVGMCPPTLHSL